MTDGDENVVTKQDLLGWTPRLVFWNTIGTLLGGAAGLVALVIVLVEKL